MTSPVSLAKSLGAAILAVLGTFLDPILFVLSFKVFPLVWHLRSYYSFLFRYLFDERPVPPNKPDSIPLFQPTIWTSGTPLGEIDIQGHKSNSTYFTDFDAARNYHMCRLFRTGLRACSGQGLAYFRTQNRADGGSEPFYPAVGSVSCTFRKPVKPRQKYDIVTQVLSWDEKWVYLISHFVKKGAFNPVHFSDEPKRNIRAKGEEPSSLPYSREAGPTAESAVLAIAIGRVVFKKGRKTVPPDTFLRTCGHLPDYNTSDGSVGVSKEERDNASEDDEKKTLEAIEERRIRGLRVAQSINGLDEGLCFFDPTLSTAYAKF